MCTCVCRCVCVCHATSVKGENSARGSGKLSHGNLRHLMSSQQDGVRGRGSEGRVQSHLRTLQTHPLTRSG